MDQDIFQNGQQKLETLCIRIRLDQSHTKGVLRIDIYGPLHGLDSGKGQGLPYARTKGSFYIHEGTMPKSDVQDRLPLGRVGFRAKSGLPSGLIGTRSAQWV